YALPRGTCFRSRRRGRAARRRSANFVPPRPLLLRGDPPPSSHRTARPAPRAGVGARALAVHRQPATVPYASIAPDLHQALDVQVDFPTQITFDRKMAVDVIPQARDLVLGQLPHPRLGPDPHGAHRLTTLRAPDAMDIRQRDPHLLVIRNV